VSWALLASLVAWVLVAEWRISRLVRAAKHHEHVMRLTLDTLASEKATTPHAAHSFARMVLDEEAWDPRDRMREAKP